MAVITKQELEDAAADALSFEKVVNGTPTEGGTGVITTRLGQQVKTLSKAIAELSVSGTVYPDTTAGLAATAEGMYFSVPADTAADFLILYRKVSGAAIEQKRYPSASVVEYVKPLANLSETELINLGSLVEYQVWSTYTGMSGFVVPYDCTAQTLRVMIYNASGTGKIVVLRHTDTTAGKYIAESITDVTYSAGVNTFTLNVSLNKGDSVMFGTTSGGVIRTHNQTLPFYCATANLPGSVGSVVAVTDNTVKTSMILSVSKSGKNIELDSTLAGLSVKSSSATTSSTTQTLGNSSLESLTRESTYSYSCGAKEPVPFKSFLTKVKYLTKSLNSPVAGLLVIYRNVFNTFYVDQLIPVSSYTDSDGYAILTPAEFGTVKVNAGDIIHIYSPNTAQAAVIYSTGVNQGSVCAKTAYAVDDASSVSLGYGNKVALDYTVEQIPFDKLSSKISLMETTIDWSSSTSGGVDGVSGPWASTARTFGHAAKSSGVVVSLQVEVGSAGTGEVHVFENLQNGTYKVKQIVPVTLANAGFNEVVLPTAVAVKTGDLIGYANKTSGGVYYYSAKPSEEPYGFLIAQSSVGQDAILYSSSFGQTYANVQFVISPYPGSSVGAAVSELQSFQAATEYKLGQAENGNQKNLVKSNFPGTSLPSGWTASGSWTVNEGLISPATGGWTTYAISAGDSSISRRRFFARIKVVNTASVFGICTKPPENSGGAVAMVDGTANKLRIYSWDGTATAGTCDTEVALPANLVANRFYTLEVIKDGMGCSVTFTDTVTQQSCTASEYQKSAYRQWHGRAGIMFHSGSIKVDWMEVDAMHNESLRAIIIGDSNSEGHFLPVGSPSWAFQAAAVRKLAGDVLLAVRAGDETPNFIARKMHDLLPWKPKYVVLALGTNDTVQDTWRTNTAATISEIVALGAEPILCTQIPRTASQSLRSAMNADIRSGYFGRYHYIDLAYAVSLNNDGETWDPAYNYGDNTHANAAGQVRMFQQLLTDAPFVLK